MARVEESDYDAAFDALSARQRRRSLVVLFTELADPDTSATLLARLAQLRGRHRTGEETFSWARLTPMLLETTSPACSPRWARAHALSGT